MAKRKQHSYPRRKFWRQALGVDYYTSGGGEAYSEEYQAILDRATTLGYTHPSTAQKTKQNQLIVDLKDAGIWDLLDLFYVFAIDGDSDFATLNWKSPSSFQCSKVNTTTFTTNQGFNGNGTTSYLNPNWNISTNAVNYTQDNASAGIWAFNTIVSAAKIAFGCDMVATSGQGFAIGPFYTGGNFRSKLNSLNYTSNLLASATGLFSVRRNNSSNYDAYKNATLVANNSVTSGARPSLVPYIGALNTGTGAGSFYDGTISMAYTGAYLDPALIHTAFNTYLTSL